MGGAPQHGRLRRPPRKHCLSDDENDPLKWQFPSGTVAAGGYVCVYLSGLGSEADDGIHTAFRLSSEDDCLL